MRVTSDDSFVCEAERERGREAESERVSEREREREREVTNVCENVHFGICKRMRKE